MNTIVINVNGTILNLTVKCGATVSITVVEEENENVMEKEVEKEVEKEKVADDISEISFHEEDTVSESDSVFEYVELCKPSKVRAKSSKPSKVHAYARDDDGNYICPYCKIVKEKCNTMSEHVRHKHSSEYGRKTDMYVCKYENCDMSFAVKPGLDQHILNCHSEKYIKCPFPDCDHNSARNDSTIVSHYVRNHMDYKNMYKKDNKISICNNCKMSCKSTNINYHLGRCYKTSPFYKNK